MPCRDESLSRRAYQRIASLILVSLCTFSAAAEPIEITLWPLPGIVNVIDGQPTGGLSVAALSLLMARLPDLEPDYKLANRPRQQYLMEQGHNLCSLPLLRRDDTDVFGYFIPFMAATPIQAVVRLKDVHRFPLEDGDLSLARVLSETTLRAGKSGFRTYPASIERWLDQALMIDRAETVTGSQSGENLLLMVSHGRIDLTFELASISHALTQGLHMPEPLVSLPIKEQRSLFETGIYCTRNPWGHAMAQRMDQAVRELAAEPADLLTLYYEAMPQETWAVFSPAMAEYYRIRAMTPTAFEPPASISQLR